MSVQVALPAGWFCILWRRRDSNPHLLLANLQHDFTMGDYTIIPRRRGWKSDLIKLGQPAASIRRTG